MKLGLIAGNGRFPFLLLDAARAQGFAVTVAAIREETDPEINDRAAADEKITVHWLSLGELSRLIEVFHKEDVMVAVMARTLEPVEKYEGSLSETVARIEAKEDLRSMGRDLAFGELTNDVPELLMLLRELERHGADVNRVG